MTEHRKITCDDCERDLTTTTNSVNYRIGVHNENIPSHSGAVTDMNIFLPIEASLHFCGLGCLKRWAMKNITLAEEIPQ